MEKELLTGVLTKAYNKTSEEIAELLYEKAADSDEVTLKEGALNLVLDLDTARVERLKSSATLDKTQIKNLRDQHIKEIMEDFEKKIKTTYGVDSTSKGIDLVKEIIDQVSECDISDEKVKTTSLCILSLKNSRVQKIMMHFRMISMIISQTRTNFPGLLKSNAKY